MSLAPGRLELPGSLQQQLQGFRRKLWTIKLTEAAAAALFGVIMAWLSVFVLDRLWDTPAVVRGAAFLAAWAAFSVGPLFLHRWVWRHRRLEQLARLMARKLPAVGDQLLGVIELVGNESEQARSPALCAAAVRQAAEETGRRDLTLALPASRHRLWAVLAVLAVGLVAGLAIVYPEAAGNAAARFAFPWRNTPRYTFADLQELPETVVAPHGEPHRLTLRLADQTRWSPPHGQVVIGSQPPVRADLSEQSYTFELPPQIEPAWLHVRIGDFVQRVRLQPEMRPALTSLTADVQLPEYLQLNQPRTVDVRGGVVSLVKGATAAFTAQATRTLAQATVDDQPAQVNDDRLITPRLEVSESRKLSLQWRDQLGLSASEPFVLEVNAAEDEPPSLICEDLPRRRVVLDSEQLQFQIRASDDYGVKQVGMTWKGVADAVNGNPAEGERILAAGDPANASMEVAGSFTATYLKIEPQPLELRIYVEDYYPGRERVYSAPYLLYVLNAEQHAIWMTEQLSKWHRQSLEVRDRELQLYETNKQLRELTAAELDQPDNRRRLEAQAAAERANGRRLASLTEAGEQLVLQASRNPEFGVGHLEKWAEMLQLLKDIAGNRMPSVADLLQQASQAETLAAQQKPSGPAAGQVRAAGGGGGDESGDDNQQPQSQTPAIVDTESTQQPPAEGDSPPPSSGQSSPRLTLPSTTLLGGGPSGDACPAGEKTDQAVQQQRDLLAEFEKIADELNQILGNLEGSTLVKRLKAASREQYQVAGRIGEFLDDAFGRGPSQIEAPTRELFQELSDVESRSSFKISSIMDDMQAYFERRRFMQFKSVLDDMKQQDVVGNLRQLSGDLLQEHGLSIAQCEYWSDAMDRWAEDLVDPASGGT